MNSENATFIKEETFNSYSEYFVESLRYGYRKVYGKYLLANNRLRLTVAFLLQPMVLLLLCSISIKSSQLQKEKRLCFLFMEGNVAKRTISAKFGKNPSHPVV